MKYKISYYHRRARFFKYLIGSFILFLTLQYFGVFVHLFEKSFKNEFKYPYEGNVSVVIQELRRHQPPSIPPQNFYNHTFIYPCSKKCSDTYHKFIRPRLVYVVKSAMDHFERRLAIRKSWGYEQRFSDVLIRVVFILGTSHSGELQSKIAQESQRFQDIVQANFIDTYYNNTIKTMIGFKWAATYCPSSNFYMFVDDDMYVSTKNVLRFIRHPTNYPEYLLEPIYALQRDHRINKRSIESTNSSLSRAKRQVYDFELPSNIRLLAGYVFQSSPHRHLSSKWYITLDEYPYDRWPSYVTAGAYVVSREALLDLYYTSFYTKHFRFDDIYVGLLALKAGIEPFHCDEFYFYKKEYTVHNYRFVIASHGYENTNELLRVWNEQKSAGNA